MKEARMLSESRIACEVGMAVRDRLIRGLIRSFQRMNYCLSGECSGLTNIWDEICVQQQAELSFSWAAYQQTIDAEVEYRVSVLPDYELDALWLLTREGDEWSYESEDMRQPYPVFKNDIEVFLSDELLSVACNWSNTRITSYLNRRYQD